MHPLLTFVKGIWGFPGGGGKEATCQCGRCGFDPWVVRSPGEGNGYPLQYSCLENSMDRRAWRTTVKGVPKTCKESNMTKRLNNNNKGSLFSISHSDICIPQLLLCCLRILYSTKLCCCRFYLLLSGNTWHTKIKIIHRGFIKFLSTKDSFECRWNHGM